MIPEKGLRDHPFLGAPSFYLHLKGFEKTMSWFNFFKRMHVANKRKKEEAERRLRITEDRVLSRQDDIFDPLNPLSPLSPINPLNPLSPLNPLWDNHHTATPASPEISSTVPPAQNDSCNDTSESSYSSDSSSSYSSYDSSSSSSYDSGSCDSGSSFGGSSD